MKQHKRLLLFVVILLVVSLPLTIYLALTSQLLQKKATGPASTVSLYLSTFPETYTYEEEFTVTLGIDTQDSLFSSAVISLEYNENDIELISIATEPEFDYLGDDPTITSVKTFSILSSDPATNTPGETISPATLTFRVLTKNKSGTISLDLPETSVIGVDTNTSQDVTLTVTSTATVGYHLPGPLCRLDMCTAEDTILLDTLITDDNRYAVYLTWQTVGDTNGIFYKIYRNSGQPVPQDHPEEYFVGITSTMPDTQFPAGTTGYTDTNNGTGFTPDQTLFYDIDTYALCTQ